MPSLTRSTRFRSIGLAAVILFLSFWATLSEQAEAQSEVAWSRPQVLFRAEEEFEFDYPVLVSSPYGLVTLFWTSGSFDAADGPEKRHVIYCSQWNGSNWSFPADVLISPDSAPNRFVDATLDSTGIVHVVWTGTNSLLYYSQASLADACIVQAWSEPIAISHTGVLRGAIAADGDDNLHVTYAARGENVYHITGTQDGSSWTVPVSVSAVIPNTEGTDEPHIAVDRSGNIHIVWDQAVLPDGDPWVGTFYSRSTDIGRTWSVPRQVAGEDYGNIYVFPGRGDDIHITWNGNIGFRGRYHQLSTDKGITWEPTQEIVPKEAGGGKSGAPRLAFDSAGTLHMVSGTDSAVHYGQWADGQWSSSIPIAFSQGDLDGFHEQAMIAINNGNEIIVIFQSGGHKLGFIRGLSDSPVAKPLPFPRTEQNTEDLSAEDDQSLDVTIPVDQTVIQPPSIPLERQERATNQNIRLALAIVPVILLLVITVAVQLRRQGRLR